MRRYWNWVHHGSGRALVGLAIANTYIGIHLGQRLSSAERTAMYTVYSALLAAIAAVWLLKEICFARRQEAAMGDEVRSCIPNLFLNNFSTSEPMFVASPSAELRSPVLLSSFPGSRHDTPESFIKSCCLLKATVVRWGACACLRTRRAALSVTRA